MNSQAFKKEERKPSLNLGQLPMQRNYTWSNKWNESTNFCWEISKCLLLPGIILVPPRHEINFVQNYLRLPQFRQLVKQLFIKLPHFRLGQAYSLLHQLLQLGHVYSLSINITLTCPIQKVSFAHWWVFYFFFFFLGNKTKPYVSVCT